LFYFVTVQTTWLNQLQSAQEKYLEDNQRWMRSRISSISTDENQLMSYLRVTWPTSQSTFTNNQSLSPIPTPTPTPPILHLPSVSRRSTSPSSASPGGSRDRSPSLGTARDRSPSAGTVPSLPFLTVSTAADRTPTSDSDDRSTENHLQAPTAWDSGSGADRLDPGSGADSLTAGGKQPRPVSLYSRRRTILKSIREKSLSIDVDLQRPPATNDVMMPMS